MTYSEALSLSTKPLPVVKVSAQVILSILNAHSRREGLDTRVVGTLLGEVKDNVVHVTECFTVKFSENLDEHTVVFDTKYHAQMYAFHRRNQKKEVIVGWFATTLPSGAFLNDNSSLVHDFYVGEVMQQVNQQQQQLLQQQQQQQQHSLSVTAHPLHAVHLVVDTSLLSDDVVFKAFVAHKNVVGDTFSEINTLLEMNDCEASLLRQLVRGQQSLPRAEQWTSSTIVSPLVTPVQRLNDSLNHVVTVLDQLSVYVDEVVAQKRVPNRELGVALAEALQSFGPLATATSVSAANSSSADAQQQQQHPLQQQQQQVMKLLNGKYQDLLMVSYLSTLAQSQVLVAEKLNQII